MLEKLNKSHYIMIIFFFISLGTFFPSFYNLDFFWDDERFVFANPSFYKAPSFIYFWIKNSEFFKSWPLGYSIFYFFIKILNIDNLFFFKLINIFFHSLNGFIVYKILLKKQFPFPILLSLIFLVHPLHVETVSWIFQLFTILATFFLFISYYYFLDFFEEKKIKFILIALLFFQFSLWTKSIALFYPIFLSAHFLFKDRRKLSFLLIPFFVISFLAGIESIIGTKTHSPALEKNIQHKKEILEKLENINKNFSFNFEKSSDKFLTNEEAQLTDLLYVKPIKKEELVFKNSAVFSQAIWHYYSKLLIPINLNFIYQKIEILWLSITITLLIFLILILSLYKKKYFLSLGIFLGITAIFPYLGFNFISFFYWSYVSDRYTYLFCLSLPIILGQFKIYNFKKILIPYILVLIFLSINQSYFFNSPIKLYSKILNNLKHPVIYSNLFEQNLKNLNVYESEKILNEAFKLFPNDPELIRCQIRLNALKNNLQN